MMKLCDLAKLTGTKSVSEMTDDEIREHLRGIRHSRLQSKAKQREEKPRLNMKAAEDMSLEELEQMLAALEAKND